MKIAVFFFSSRRRHTRSLRDWSSDVCSSDLGWRVLELKYGRWLREAFQRGGGELLRRQIDAMPNERYQALFGAEEESIRAALQEPLGGEERATLGGLLNQYTGRLHELVSNLGGHDL